MPPTLPSAADFQRCLDVMDSRMLIFVLDDYQSYLRAAAEAGWPRRVISQIENRVELLVDEVGTREFQPELPF